MVSHIIFGGLTNWGPTGQTSPFASPPLFLYMHAVQELHRCVEVKSIQTFSTYSVFRKSIDSKDDNYCTVLISKWFEHAM